MAKTAGHIGDDVYNVVLAASLITILLNAMLIRCIPGFERETCCSESGILRAQCPGRGRDSKRCCGALGVGLTDDVSKKVLESRARQVIGLRLDGQAREAKTGLWIDSHSVPPVGMTEL